MSIVNSFLGVTLSVGLLLSASACSTVKVDCDKMCKRTFRECVVEVMLASKKVTQKQLDELKAKGGIKNMQDKGYERCMKDCKKRKGIGSDAGKINKCLAKKGCKDFAECIQPHLK